MGWFHFYLVVHIVGVLLAFGPTFGYPFFGMLVQRYPQAALLFVEGTEVIAKRLTLPLGVVVPLAGVGMIYTAHIDLWASGWLIVSIILYAAAYSYGLLVQLPTDVKLLHLLKSMGPPPAGAAGPPAGVGAPGAPAGGPPAGPPPEVARLSRKLRLGGAYLSASVLIIAILMIWQPGHPVHIG
jgi:uncharacterized membrane protein